MQQLNTQIGFKLTQLPRQGGLSNRDCSGCRRQAAGIGNRNEIAQGSQIHGLLSTVSQDFQ
jgi:hypothetical protein